MKYYFIYNPVAGQGKTGQAFVDSFTKLKQENKYDMTLHQTIDIGDAKDFAEKVAVEAGNEDICVFAVGGDGTMNDVINGIAGHKNVIFGIVPTGSCNDFLKNFDGYDFLDIERQMNGKTMEVDLMKVNDFYSLNVTNIGFDAKVNYDQICFRPKHKTVKQAYNHAIIHNLLKKLGDPVNIKVDGSEIFDGKMLLMAMGNGGYYGGGYNCAPKTILDDGMLDITIVKKVSILKFATLIGKYKNGEVYGNDKFKKLCVCKRGKVIEVESPIALTVCLDGETIHTNHVKVECMKKAIRFMLPKKEYNK